MAKLTLTKQIDLVMNDVFSMTVDQWHEKYQYRSATDVIIEIVKNSDTPIVARHPEIKNETEARY